MTRMYDTLTQEQYEKLYKRSITLSVDQSGYFSVEEHGKRTVGRTAKLAIEALDAAA